MALSTLWRGGSPEPESQPEVSLGEFLTRYDIVDINDTPGQEYAIVTEKGKALADPSTDAGNPDMRELGTTSPSPWVSFRRREYNPKLIGLKGLEQYDRMRKSDGTVRGTLRVIKTPVLGARWFIEPGGPRKMDKRAADFVWSNLTEGMSISWMQVLTEALLMFDFGYYMFEKVYDTVQLDGNSRTVWKKLAPRHPMDVESWEFDSSDGGPLGCWVYVSDEDLNEAMQGLPGDQYGPGDPGYSPYPGMDNAPTGGVSGIPNLPGVYGQGTPGHPGCRFIPIDKLLVFTFDREAGNIEGVSVLRSAYKHWYFKEQLYKIDAIQKERHGIGIPVIKLPQGYKDEDKKAAEELGRNIRTNERAHIVLPPGWEVNMLKLEGNPVDAMKSIQHHDELIEKNIVAYFLNSGRNVDVDMFLKSVRFAADIVADTFNLYAIPQLVKYNFPNAKMPKLRHRHIGEAVDWRTMSFAIRNFIGAGVITPDQPMEDNIRDELGLPQADPSTARDVLAPQSGPQGDPNSNENDPSKAPGQRGTGNTPAGASRPKLPRTGPPRQAPVGRQRNTRGLPKPDAGRDNSGGR
jgi:hypothetical protein